MLKFDVLVIVPEAKPIVAVDAPATNFESGREPAIMIPLANAVSHFWGGLL
jgi:hypothetical protein